MFDETEATLPFLLQYKELQIALDMWWDEASDRFRCGEISVLRIAEATGMARTTVYKKLQSYYPDGWREKLLEQVWLDEHGENITRAELDDPAGPF